MMTRKRGSVSLRRSGFAACLLTLFALAACGQTLDTAPPDPAPDASRSDSGRGTLDASVDTGVDAGVDASVDTGVDATVDAGCGSDSDCENGLLCDGIARCVEGSCVMGDPVDCADDFGCTVDTCSEEAGGCVHTVDDSVCGGSRERPKVCTVDRGCIRAQRCSDTMPCPTSNCAGVWRCDAGICHSLGAPTIPVSECVVTECAPDDPASDAQGWIVTRMPDVCDDGANCTADTCEIDGSCSHVDIAAFCADLWRCTEDVCAPGDASADENGCVSRPQDALCPDAYGCTVDTCVPADPAADPVSGCVHEPVDTSCDDGIDCTIDTCDRDAGCTSTASNALCDDFASCTRDICVPRLGLADSCVNVPRDGRCGTGAPAGTCVTPVCAPAASSDTPGTGCAAEWDSSLCSSFGTGGGGPGVCRADGSCGLPTWTGAGPCSVDADCDDRNPCNGDEVCRFRSCHKSTNGCPPAAEGSCMLPVCDTSTGILMCGFRPDPDCLVTVAGVAGG